MSYTFQIDSQPVDESGFVDIGGLTQWLTIRGEDRRNPVILMIHGGPGLANSPFSAWFRCWERHFTLVQWDQRGAGKTFGRYRQRTPAMSREQIVQDGIAVTEHLRRRLGQERIILFCHSFGSTIGLTMAARRPDLFSTYVAAAQVVDLAQQESLYDTALAAAHAAKHGRAVQALTRLGPGFRTPERMVKIQALARAYVPPSERRFTWKFLTTGVTARGYGPKAFADVMAGHAFAMKALFADMISFDARALGKDFALPLVLISGDSDAFTPGGPAKAWLDSVTAPAKTFHTLAGQGHMAPFMAPDGVLDILVERLLCQAQGQGH